MFLDGGCAHKVGEVCDDCRREARRQLGLPVTPAPPEASHRAIREWQPIETAPKDGTQVWAWDAERGSNPALWVEGAWWITYDDAMIHPTHWMPLPDPPAALSTGTETQEPQAK
jgi:hypothetical protein